MIRAVRQLGLEGVIGKRKDSRYEAGKRSESWAKYRLNRGQERVIGGYVPGTHGLDSIIVGYYRSKELMYIATVRNGFVPATRRQIFGKLRPLEIAVCPFVNLPETHKGRWGDGLTAEDMEKCVWVRPELAARVEFFGMDRSAPCKVCWIARRQGSSQGNQGAWRRRVITLAILSQPIIEVGKPPLRVP